MDIQPFFRHFLATLAYRGGKCLRDAPDSFIHYDTGNGRTPLDILAHIGDLLEWTLAMADGQGRWKANPPGTWDQEAARFHQDLERLDRRLASGEPLQADEARLLQGPLADAMTHVGQLALLRRMAGAPVQNENYFLAEISQGRVGADQAPPRRPF
ncbi:MAG: hypothetical protein ABSH53_11160 [Holophaga sp.]|jgi:hypothetical protein